MRRNVGQLPVECCYQDVQLSQVQWMFYSKPTVSSFFTCVMKLPLLFLHLTCCFSSLPLFSPVQGRDVCHALAQRFLWLPMRRGQGPVLRGREHHKGLGLELNARSGFFVFHQGFLEQALFQRFLCPCNEGTGRERVLLHIFCRFKAYPTHVSAGLSPWGRLQISHSGKKSDKLGGVMNLKT